MLRTVRFRRSMPMTVVAAWLMMAPTAAAQQGAPGGQPRGQAGGAPPTIESKTAAMQKLDGFFPLYWEESTGSLFLEISRLDTDVLYFTGLQAGVGSNDIGLDRGQGGGAALARFERVGPKIFLVQPNLSFRAISDSPDERRAVEDSFARSILWGFSVSAETGGRVLIDLTDFILRDAHGVVQRLRPAQFRLDRSRSAVHMPRTKNFPKNTEMEVTLTYVTDGPTQGAGGGVAEGALSAVAPDDQAVTVRQHHSFIELPGPGFKARRYDSRSGAGALTYQNFSAPLSNQMGMTERIVRRHRLAKKDPAAKLGDPVKPIVYYLDRGTPEPIRSALLEGARWWNQAFEAAGYRNGFQVELMPEGADPMDVRYNVIQWVHRSTRGWSYGGSVSDPRTGEIIQGRVTLGSLRVRQDYLIAEGLLAPYVSGTETAAEAEKMSLARLRQLSAHEVGHTLGFGHNYYDSTKGRISVLDYPQPLTKLRADGTVDLSDAYAVGIGEWDKVMVTWAYQDFPAGTNEDAALRKIIDDAWAQDLRYMSNQDTDANPRVDQWSNGTDPAAELDRMMQVRRAALTRFGENAIKKDVPLAQMEEVLVPLYLHHRYQVEAAASALGGQHYIYALRGDGREPYRWVPAGEQRAALEAMMKTLAPAELVIPDHILKKLPPRPGGYQRHRELFPRYTGMIFDAVTPAVVASDLTVGFILQGDRAARMVEQHAIDTSLPGLEEIVDRLIKVGFEPAAANAYEAEVQRAIARVVVDRLMALAATVQMPQVRAIATWKLDSLRDKLTPAGGTVTNAAAASARLIAEDIKRFLERPAEPYKPTAAPAQPPGAPIGDPDQWWIPFWDEPPCSAWWIDRIR